LSAAGSISIPGLDPSKVSVTFIPSNNTASLPVLVNGEPEMVDEVRAKEILSLEDFGICVDLGGIGNEEATYWTCDFSYVRDPTVFSMSAHSWFIQDYVRINGDYRS
jgi:glutamate N-acetyltransferase/amino-acid N-acetyltransferase